ncbi:MAG TPA: O-antigen ligase family protein [Thermoanaerobaculia bacterium]
MRHLAGVLVLFALPIAIDLLDSVPRARAMALAIAGSGVLISLAGLWQYARGGDDLANRIRAHLSTYMTFSGLVLVTGCLLLGFLFEERGRWRAVGLFGLFPWVAMLLTFTRNTYVGALAALVAYLALRRPKGLLALPAFLLLVFWLLPAGQRDRVRSIASLTDDTNRDRVAMAHAGARIIATFPVFGLGPDMVKPYYRHFRDPDAPSFKVPHLHNNFLQLAAQSGLPAAAAYLTLALFVIVAAGRKLRRERRPDRAGLLAGVFLASVALFAAGFFEYNFGDTEIQMATLLLWAIPFSAALGPGPAPIPRG